MNSCPNDTKVVETIYPSSDYVEERNPYGERVFKTLKPAHSKGVTVTRVLLCSACELKKSKPMPVEDRLRTIKRAEEIPSFGDWTVSQKSLSKKLELSGHAFEAKCSKCGNALTVRSDKTREDLCAECYKTFREAYLKEYKRDYMREFMRAKRETNHVA